MAVVTYMFNLCMTYIFESVWDMTMGMSCIVVVILLKKLREIRWKDDPDKPIPIYVMIYRKLIFICGAGKWK